MQMKNALLILSAAAFLFACQNETGREATPGPEPQFVIGELDSLHSEILDETRAVWVHVPGGAENAIFAKTQYPVLYLLDAPDHFHALTGMIGQLADNSLTPDMVVVGIPNTDRTRDLTPTHVDVAFGDSAFVRTSGGGELFLSFLGEELIPYIESKYPVTGYRTFVGHSFGGLSVFQALYTRPELFANYISIDPSFWWDEGVMLEWTDSVQKILDFEGKALYVGVANTMEEGMAIEDARQDTSQVTNHIRSILAFVDKSARTPLKGLSFAWNYYEEDDHGSVPLITEYDALRFLFSWYRLKGLEPFFMPESQRTAEELIAHLDSHYGSLTERFGYEVHPPESLVNSLGYNFIQRKPEYARALFELNIRNYPQSANVFDSMGDYFLAQSDTLNAIEQFRKAYELGESPFTKEKLDALLSPE